MAKATKKKHAAKKRSGSKAKKGNLVSIKASIGKVEKCYAEAFATAKKQVKQQADQTMKLVTAYNKELIKLATQDRTLQQKLLKAEAQLKTKATAANKTAVKNAKKLWENFKKQQKHALNQFKQTEAMHYMVKSAESKLNFLAERMGKLAKEWKPPVHKPLTLPKAKAVVKKKVKAVAKKVAKKVVKKAKAVSTAADSVARSPMLNKPMINKPLVSPSIPKASPMMPPRAPLGLSGLSGQGPAPIRPPFTSITPQTIARQPLTGGVRPGHDMGNKSFSFKDDF